MMPGADADDVRRSLVKVLHQVKHEKEKFIEPYMLSLTDDQIVALEVLLRETLKTMEKPRRWWQKTSD